MITIYNNKMTIIDFKKRLFFVELRIRLHIKKEIYLLRDYYAHVYYSFLAVHTGQVRQRHLRRVERGERHVRCSGGMRTARWHLQRRLREWLRGLLHR